MAWIGEKGPGQRCLLLEGHTDVVTEGDPDAWTHPPFGAEMVDGRIYGRGAADMKSGLAAAMVAPAAFKRAGVTPQGKLVVGALVDEEDAHDRRPPSRQAPRRAASWTRPSSASPRRTSSASSSAAWCGRAFRARGKMAHGAMPEAGVNPITAPRGLLAAAPGLERRLRKACEKSRYLKPPTVTPTIIQAPPPRRRSAAIERHPRACRDDPRRAADARHRRGWHPRRARGDLPRRGGAPARDQGRVGAGQRLPARHQGGPLRGAGEGHGPRGQAGDAPGRRATAECPARRTAPYCEWSSAYPSSPADRATG